MTDRSDRAGGDGLLPCPFCARDVDLINGTGNPDRAPRWLVVCEVCGSFHFDANETEQEVIVRWNTRASPPSGNAERENVVTWRVRFADGGCTAWFDGEPPNHHGPYEFAYAAPPQPAPDALQRILCGIVGTPDANGMVTFKVHESVVRQMQAAGPNADQPRK